MAERVRRHVTVPGEGYQRNLISCQVACHVYAGHVYTGHANCPVYPPKAVAAPFRRFDDRDTTKAVWKGLPMCFLKRIGWTLVVVGAFAGSELPLRGQDAAESSTPQQGDDSNPLGFAYDPEDEEGPHPDSDFEWWYQFGFLKRVGAPEFEYSFVASFQRNKSGRYLFYNLSDLATGKKLHHAFVDRSLFGAADKPAARQGPGEKTKPPRESAGLGQRLARWLQDTLPLLPEGHKFMTPPGPPADPPKSELWLDYEDQCFYKQGPEYQAVFQNPDFRLGLTLRRNGPALPVLGTGLTGLNKPEDQHYYTYPRLPAQGRLRKGAEGDMAVEGSFWYDHQWGRVVTKVPMKWCWWGLRLEDGRNLSLFFLRDGRSGDTVQQGLTVQHPDGRVEVCKDLIFSPGRSWTSPHGRTYNVAWRIETREMKLAIQIKPYTDDQELPVLLYGRIWEGPCLTEVAEPGGRVVKGCGFQEMIGQADVE